MLSVLCNRNDQTVGASTAIFGILGGFIAYLIINWVALGRFGPVRSTLTCIIVIIIVFSLLFSVGSNIDIFAHIGGLVGGLLISLAILPGMENKNRVITWVGVGGVVVMNLITFCLFFLTE
jgi:rhomboid protease GluP